MLVGLVYCGAETAVPVEVAKNSKEMNIFFAVLVGLGLSASCGFRVFVPFLVMGVAAHTGHLVLVPEFSPTPFRIQLQWSRICARNSRVRTAAEFLSHQTLK